MPLEARGKNAWRITVEFPADEQGRRRRQRETFHGNKREAQARERELQVAADRGAPFVATSSSTFGEYATWWLENVARHKVAPSTLRRYEQLAANLARVLPHRVQRLEPGHVDTAYAQLRDLELSERSMLHHHRLLKQILKHAIRQGVARSNAADLVESPRPRRHEMRVLDQDELARVLEACADQDLRRLCFVAVATGLRQGELLGLRWSDLDLAAGRASIQRSAQYLSREVTLREPKTSRSRRSIALSPSTAATLLEHRRAQNERRLELGSVWHAHDLVFPGPLGAPARGYNVTNAFRAIVRSIGLEGVRFHDLRHTSATMALRAGVHPKIVSERLGHATVTLTLDTYSHVLPDMQAEAAAALDAFLPSAGARA